jgi:hypothetical protein
MDMNVSNVLAQDAYDANQYRGVIGAPKDSRAKSKAEGEAALAAVAELVEAARDYERGTRPGANPKWADELRPALVAALAKFVGEA